MQVRSLKLMWAGALAALVIAVVLLWSSGVDVYLGAKGLVLAYLASALLLFTFRFRIENTALVRLRLMGHGLFLLTAIGIAGALLSYWVVRATPFDYADPLLSRADRTLGLDWRAIYEVYRHQSSVHLFMQHLYLSIMHIPTAIVILLALHGHDSQLGKFIVAFALSLVVTLVLFAFFPAITPLFYLVGKHPPYVPATGLDYFTVIETLRSADHLTVELHKLYGLITFPSFHAASSVIFAWAAWPLRFWRWPILAANSGMLVATPLEGAHYFIDLVAGILIAAISIQLVLSLERRAFAAKTPQPVPLPS